MGIPGLIALFLSPFLGKFTDKYGKKMIILLISSILSSLAFFSFLYLNLLLPSIIILGISYSLFTSVYWPAMAMTIINKKKISFVIGLNFSFLNFAGSVGPLIITKIKHDYNYDKVIFYLIIVNFVNILVAIFGYFHDMKNYGLLNQRKKDKNSKVFNDNNDINIKNIPLYNEEINEKDNFDNVKNISLIKK
jgi:MFS family permease